MVKPQNTQSDGEQLHVEEIPQRQRKFRERMRQYPKLRASRKEMLESHRDSKKLMKEFLADHVIFRAVPWCIDMAGNILVAFHILIYSIFLPLILYVIYMTGFISWNLLLWLSPVGIIYTASRVVCVILAKRKRMIAKRNPVINDRI